MVTSVTRWVVAVVVVDVVDVVEDLVEDCVEDGLVVWLVAEVLLPEDALVLDAVVEVVESGKSREPESFQ